MKGTFVTTLYHYCSNQAFLGTIQAKAVRLSMLSLSNDTSEGRDVRSVMASLIEDTKQREEAQSFFDRALAQHIIGFGYCLSQKTISSASGAGTQMTARASPSATTSQR